MTKGDKAKQLFENGYNCAQAVFCSFPEVTGLDNETALRVSAGLGGGMGRMREVCGAVSGMIMVLSAKYACTDPSNHEEKSGSLCSYSESGRGIQRGKRLDCLPRIARTQ